jgi:drug/metabolite transporter (DMT)-like permease
MSNSIKTYLLAVIALIAFAGNSWLNRLALGNHAIDAYSYVLIRFFSGSTTLFFVGIIQFKGNFIEELKQFHPKRLAGAASLFLYGITFSVAYLELGSGIGSLILFGTVQLSLIILISFLGEKLSKIQLLSIVLAFSGLVYLLFPNLKTPNFISSMLMIIAGISWAVYTYLGKGQKTPMLSTAINFIYTIPLLLILLLISKNQFQIQSIGILYAVISGVITSACGYIIWYAVLKEIPMIHASILQLFVPIITILGGVIFINEELTIRIIIASIIILGGILIVILKK